jgi:hypothetical protein
MSWSLALHNGDIALSGARLGQVSGPSKLVQDLRCALLEPKGFDDLHPTFGSLIDGGRDDYGNQVAPFIGTSDWDLAILRVESEIRRICADHQRKQTERSKNDRYRYGESTLTPDEMLMGIDTINMYQAQDKLLVNVKLSTAAGQGFSIDLPIAESGVLIT